MKSHKLIFLTCTILACILFADGLFTIAQVNRADRYKYMHRNDNHGMNLQQNESSIQEERPVNILLLGLDEDEKRSDVIMLLNYSPDSGNINILSIARDTRVYYKGQPVKVNALVGIGGERLIIKQVKRMTDLDVDYYIALNFAGFRKIIDTLGGVLVDVPIDMDYDDPDQNLHIHIHKGRQLLDGKRAEQFVRYRKGNRPNEGYIDGDIGRIKAQQELIREFIEQKIKLKYISKADDIFAILKEHMNTNIDIGDIRNYIGSIKNVRYEDIKAYTTPGKSVYEHRTWYFVYDRDKTLKLVRDKFFK